MQNFKVENIEGKYQVVSTDQDLDTLKTKTKKVKGTWQPIKELAVGKKTFEIDVTVFRPSIQDAIDMGFITRKRIDKIREVAEKTILSRIDSNQYDMIRSHYLSSNYSKQKTLADLSPAEQLKMLDKLRDSIQEKIEPVSPETTETE